MAQTFREKPGVGRPPPPGPRRLQSGVRQEAVDVNPSISVLLPCHVVVRSTAGDGVVIDFIDPEVLVELAGEPGIRDIADEVRTRFEMVRDTVATVTEAVA